MAAEEGNSAGQENGMAITSGVSLFLVVGEPFSDDQKELIIEKINKDLASFTSSVDGFDLISELQAIANVAPSGDEGPGGELVIENASENLRTTILINPQCQTFHTHLRNFLILGAQQRIFIYAGPVLQGYGSLIFQDDLLTFSSFTANFKEADVQNALKQQQGTTLDLHVIEEGEWKAAHFSKQAFANTLNVKVNPAEGSLDQNCISPFTSYLSSSVKVRSCKELLQSSDVVGNIRFTRPTLYVFPGAQGDSALFGISGFNLLVNAGYNKKACFWGFTRHLDRIDALLMTHLGTDNLFGAGSVFERKAYENVHPEIGHIYFNAIDKVKNSPNGDINPENGGSHKPASLVISLVEQGNRLVENMKMTGQSPQPCVGHVQSNVLQPLNLYHKVGHGTLDMYILNPSQDSKELKDFLAQWSKNVNHFTSTKNGIPMPSQTSVCALLVWKPTSPNEKITRILFPGNAPQERVFEGLEKLKTLDIFKVASCSESSLHAPKAQKKPAAGGLKAAKGPTNARSSPIPRSSPAPTTKAEPKKAAPSGDKKPTTARSTATSKPAKDAKNKRATGASQKDEKTKTPSTSSTTSKATSPSASKSTSPSLSKGTSPTASKSDSPVATPIPTSTPSNTPIETAEIQADKSEAVAAEIAASLESEITESEPKLVEVVQEPEPVVEQPVATPEDVRPVIDETPEPTPEPPTSDLLGDFSTPVAEPVKQQVAETQPEEDKAFIPEEPLVPISEPQEPLSPQADLTPVESEPSPSVESVSEPSVTEEPQAVPEPVQLESPEQDLAPELELGQLQPQEFSSVPEKELALESEKDEDTAEAEQLGSPVSASIDDSLPGELGTQDEVAVDTQITSNGIEAAAIDGLMESPKALPDPHQYEQGTFEAMQASFSEDRGENVFASPQKELEVQELPEAEQPLNEQVLVSKEEPQTETLPPAESPQYEPMEEASAVDQAFDDILKDQDALKVEAERERISISSEDEQALPTPEETRAEGQYGQDFLRAAQAEQGTAPNVDSFAAEAEQGQVDVADTAHKFTEEAEEDKKQTLEDLGVVEDDIPVTGGLSSAEESTQELEISDEPEAEVSYQKHTLADFGVTEDDDALIEGLKTADKETLRELGVYDEPEADQQQEQEQEIIPPPAAEPQPQPEADERPVDEDQDVIPPPSEPKSEEWPSRPEDVEADQIDQPDDMTPLPVDLQFPVAPAQERDGDVDDDSLVDNAARDPEGADSLECLSAGVTDVPEDVPTDPLDTSNSFEIVDAPRELDREPFTNPFVGVDLNSSTQPNPFNIPDTSSEQAQQGFPGEPENQPHIQIQQSETDRDSLEKEQIDSLEKDQVDSLEKDQADSFDPLKDWGQPMGLPAPDGPAAKKSDSAAAKKGTATSRGTTRTADAKKPATTRKAATDTKKPLDRSASPKKAAPAPASATSRTARKPADDAGKKPPSSRDAPDKKPAASAARKPAAAKPSSARPDTKSTPTKSSAGAKRPATTGAAKSAPPPKLAPVTPFYVDLTYIPGHGDNHHVDLEFFRKVRARYYVLSSLTPNASLLGSLLEAKQTWEDPTLEVTVIPTYDTDTLRHWMALHRDELNDNKIEFAPSASRCTIQLQDHEASCAAYRLEF